jgi:hypothetical protein
MVVEYEVRDIHVVILKFVNTYQTIRGHILGDSNVCGHNR